MLKAEKDLEKTSIVEQDIQVQQCKHSVQMHVLKILVCLFAVRLFQQEKASYDSGLYFQRSDMFYMRVLSFWVDFKIFINNVTFLDLML